MNTQERKDHPDQARLYYNCAHEYNWAYGSWKLFGIKLVPHWFVYDFCVHCDEINDWTIPTPNNWFTKLLFRWGWLTAP